MPSSSTDFVGDNVVLRCQKFGTPALFLINKGHVWENKTFWTLSPSESQVHPLLSPTNALHVVTESQGRSLEWSRLILVRASPPASSSAIAKLAALVHSWVAPLTLGVCCFIRLHGCSRIFWCFLPMWSCGMGVRGFPDPGALCRISSKALTSTCCSWVSIWVSLISVQATLEALKGKVLCFDPCCVPTTSLSTCMVVKMHPLNTSLR